MRKLLSVAFFAFFASSCLSVPALAQDKLASVARAATNLAAGDRNLVAGSDVFGQERVSTNGSGRGELVFVDGTKLALGPSSSLIITKSLLRGKNRFAKLGLMASRGSFRWISGSSGSSAYALSTPIGTIGIRGTAVDITVVGGRVFVALLSGRARVCGGGGCQELTRTCEYVELGGRVSKTKQISAGFKSRADAARAFPYLANPSQLSGRFRVGGGCFSNSSFEGAKPRIVPAVVPGNKPHKPPGRHR
jgi:hypothetical protein